VVPAQADKFLVYEPNQVISHILYVRGERTRGRGGRGRGERTRGRGGRGRDQETGLSIHLLCPTY